MTAVCKSHHPQEKMHGKLLTLNNEEIANFGQDFVGRFLYIFEFLVEFLTFVIMFLWYHILV